MTKALDIFIDGELAGMNTVIGANRSNRFAGATLKKQADAQIIACLRLGKIAPLPDAPFIWTFIWQCKNKRRDPDNIASGAKFVFDALQKSGILQNDGWGQVAEIHHYFEVSDTPGVHVLAHSRG